MVMAAQTSAARHRPVERGRGARDGHGMVVGDHVPKSAAVLVPDLGVAADEQGGQDTKSSDGGPTGGIADGGVRGGLQ